MKINKQKIAGKLAISFLLIMLFTTFLAKSIRYYTSPKVVMVSIDRGRLTDGKYYDCIIPTSALSEDNQSVFVLQKRKSFWGDEYYVKKVKVQIEALDVFNAAISEGLMFNDLIITSWDRDIKDEIRVEVI